MLLNVLDDFSNKSVFDSDDERWKELHTEESLHHYLNIQEEDASCFRELLVNNSYTFNFQRLVDQVVNRMKTLERQKGAKSTTTIVEVCAGICLITVIIQYASQKLGPAEVTIDY